MVKRAFIGLEKGSVGGGASVPAVFIEGIDVGITQHRGSEDSGDERVGRG